MPWTFNGTDFASLKVTRCVRQSTTTGDDGCDVAFSGSAPGGLSAGTAVTIAGDGGTFFTGVVWPRGVVAAKEGSAEGDYVRLEGGWKVLERTPMQTPWASGSGSAPVYSGRVRLGIADDGTLQTADEAITAVLTWAGVSGTVSVSSQTIPPVELVDVTCAQVIRAVLRWFPDAIILTDRSSGALTITRVSTYGQSVTVSAPLVSHEPQERPDLALRGVVINWETVTTVDGETYRVTHPEIEGASTGERVFIATVELQGGNITTVRQPVVTEAIPQTKEDSGLGDWLKKKFDDIKLANLVAGDVECLRLTQTIDEDTLQGDAPEGDKFPRELTGGTIQEWMGVSSGSTAVEVVLKLKKPGKKKLRKLFMNAGAENIATWTWRGMGTTATTQTYSELSGGGTAEEPPAEGLAAEIYAAASATEKQGQIGWTEDAPAVGITAGKLLTCSAAGLTGVRIQSATADVWTGRTTLEYGPMAAVLGPQEYMEMLRAQRVAGGRTATFPRAAKTDAKRGSNTSSGPVSSPGGHTPRGTRTESDRAARFFSADMGGEDGDHVKVNAGMVMSTDWTGFDPYSGAPTKMAIEWPVTEQTLDVAEGETVYCKVTFADAEYQATGPLVEPVIYSVSGGRGGDGGPGGAGGDGGTGGSGGMGGKGGDCPAGSGSGSGPCDCPGGTGLPGEPGEAGGPGGTGLAGGSGGSGQAGSTAEIPVFQKYQGSIRIVSVSGVSLETHATTPTGDAATAYYPIVRLEAGEETGSQRLVQLHEGILSVPSAVSFYFV